MTWPITGAMVRSYEESSEPVTPGLELAVAAVVAYVPTIPGLQEFYDETTFEPPADVEFGAIMLAARWYARRGALLGASAGYSDFGTQTILRHDPDIARLLRIGTSSPGLVFGAPTTTTEETS